MPDKNTTTTATHTDSRASGGRADRRTLRRRLRREVPGTLGLLADPADFAAMRRYRSFPFDGDCDHADYLAHVEALLRSLAGQGVHTTVALFDPEEYADYCTEHGLDPDTAGARTSFTAELAGAGGCLSYTGRPIGELVPLLIDEAVRQATWEYATTLLADVGSCADCGEDIGRASLERAAGALKRLVDGAGPGHHHLVCSVPTDTEQLVAVLHAEAPGADSRPRIEGRDGIDFVTVLAAGLALGGPGGL
ncbi:hypothetical protein, partial [Streptomyces sp. NPDC054838]